MGILSASAGYDEAAEAEVDCDEALLMLSVEGIEFESPEALLGSLIHRQKLEVAILKFQMLDGEGFDPDAAAAFISFTYDFKSRAQELLP